jgi:hypothetical protein
LLGGNLGFGKAEEIGKIFFFRGRWNGNWWGNE